MMEPLISKLLEDCGVAMQDVANHGRVKSERVKTTLRSLSFIVTPLWHMSHAVAYCSIHTALINVLVYLKNKKTVLNLTQHHTDCEYNKL